MSEYAQGGCGFPIPWYCEAEAEERTMVKHYDKACFDLALSFLQDSNCHADRQAELADSLAIDIQQAIEDFFKERNVDHG